MEDDKQQTDKTTAKKVYYWDETQTNIGVCLTQRSGKRGDFFTFEPLRSYRRRRDGQLKMCYTHSFTEEQAEAFGNVIVWALAYIRENQPLEEAESSEEDAALQIAA